MSTHNRINLLYKDGAENIKSKNSNCLKYVVYKLTKHAIVVMLLKCIGASK